MCASGAHTRRWKWYREYSGPPCEGNMKCIKYFVVFGSIFVDREAQCRKDTWFPQINLQIQGISTNIPEWILIKTKELILNLIWKSKGPKIARTIFKKFEGWGTCKLYMWAWYRDAQIAHDGEHVSRPTQVQTVRVQEAWLCRPMRVFVTEWTVEKLLLGQHSSSVGKNKIMFLLLPTSKINTR